ncbi:MAG TPA: hypothetical protein O0X01_00100 [Methanocorpusculum sp.]|nr:hypothetical protein [Methanocorpusculum sp.]
MVCQGHEELRDIAIETRSSVDNLNKNLAMFIERSDECDKRIRNLELNGAKVSQTNAKDIEILKSDVDILKSNEDVRKGIEKQAIKTAALVGGIISGIISFVCVIIPLLLS